MWKTEIHAGEIILHAANTKPVGLKKLIVVIYKRLATAEKALQKKLKKRRFFSGRLWEFKLQRQFLHPVDKFNELQASVETVTKNSIRT